MRKRIMKTFAAALMITCITGSTVFADEVTDIKNEQSQIQSDIDSYEDQLAYLLVQIDDMEQKMADLNTAIADANDKLVEAEEVQQKQYDDMKLRIKFLYEDQSTTLTEVLLTSTSMSEMLNKTEYVQQVYDYDREKLTEMANTASEIKNIKAELESDQNEMLAMQDEFMEKKAVLYSAINEAQTKFDDAGKRLTAALNKAAASRPVYSNSGTANNDSSVASSIVSYAYQFLGVPYVYGGSTPSGFDCSGFTSYVFANAAGISLARTSGGQTYGGAAVGSISEALPGDIICYPGHVGIYIGGGQMIHAPTTGDVVKVSSVNIGMSIVAIRRYW